MAQAIVYVSETGHTKQYAELLSEKIGLPAYELKEAVKVLPKKAEILYLGWLMASTVKGYKKAAKRFTVKAVGGVGMSGGTAQLADMRKVNRFSEDLPVFYLQGGFEMEKLHGIYGFMMKMMKNTVGKGIENKENRTPEEEDMLMLLLHGGNKVSGDNLKDLLSWYGQMMKQSATVEKIVNAICQIGYKVKEKDDRLEIYRVNDKGYVCDDIYFVVTPQNELHKNERNAESILDKYDSLELCLLNLFFMLKYAHQTPHYDMELENRFIEAKSIEEIKEVVCNSCENKVNDALFFNEYAMLNDGIYVNVYDEKIRISLKKSKYVLLLGINSFEKKHLILDRVSRFVCAQSEIDEYLRDFDICLSDYQYLESLSNYAFGFSVLKKKTEDASING